jgi:VIT1/CCC1 family predicted Fe2+/Mn2+ transporter
MTVSPPHDSRLPAELLRSHTPSAIRERLHGSANESYLRDFVYGAIDGAVTTFAVVSGVAGAGLNSSVIIILGIANLVGDGFSMAAGNFLATRAHLQLRHRVRRMEERHIDEVPDGEREEIRQIFAAQGFAGDDLERVVTVITSDRAQWIETMLREEHGFSGTVPSPLTAAGTTFVAFCVVGLIPLLPFLIEVSGAPVADPYRLSTVLTGVSFFAVGFAKGKVVDEPSLWSGLETLLVGGLAAGLAYLCGLMLSGIA